MNRKTFAPTLTLLLTVFAAGCGGSNSPTPVEPEQPILGALKAVTSEAELEAAIKAGFTTISSTSSAESPLATSSAGDASAGNFTGTYTQEQDVDEFDAVRYDGSHLFVAPRRYLPCCYLAQVASDGAMNTGRPANASIRILATDPANGSATLAGSIPLDDDVSVQGMFIDGDRMLALTATLMYGGYGNYFADFAIWAPEKLGYQVYDIADPASPTLEAEVSIDGVFVDSRRVGNVVYIVSRFTPTIDGLIYHVTTAAEQAQNQAVLANVTLDKLLPKVRINGVERTLVGPARCFIGTDDEIGYPVITSVTAVPIDNPTDVTTTCYDEDAYGIYMSEQSIYFTNIVYDSGIGDTKTRIHKFALAGTALSYRGSADIEGQLWRGGQADFRMSEHNGDLRVLATLYNSSSTDFVDHKLTILRESSAAPELEVLAELPNAQRPEEIGKPNEALYGVRFLGDRAYAVTFERIDPLYVIDLADPSDPKLAGELEVEGFSDFLHPVSAELLLGLGVPAGGGVKLELFDVSDIAQPLSRGSQLLGGPGSYSEANHDRHAFTYQADVNGIDRLAIPALVYSEGAEGGQYDAALYLFEIHDKTQPEMAALLAAGTITPPTTDSLVPYDDRNRAFIHDDTVYYVRGEDVWAAFWNAPTIVNGPF
jgi:uncharacterized secreted protein with C-terminal beta-propeller domain